MECFLVAAFTHAHSCSPSFCGMRGVSACFPLLWVQQQQCILTAPVEMPSAIAFGCLVLRKYYTRQTYYQPMKQAISRN